MHLASLSWAPNLIDKHLVLVVKLGEKESNQVDWGQLANKGYKRYAKCAPKHDREQYAYKKVTCVP